MELYFFPIVTFLVITLNLLLLMLGWLLEQVDPNRTFQTAYDIIEREIYFFLSMGDRTRNLISLHIRLVPLPFEPFQHLLK